METFKLTQARKPLKHRYTRVWGSTGMDCVISVFFHVATLFLTIRRTDTGVCTPVPLSLSRVLRVQNGQRGRVWIHVGKFDAVSFYFLDDTLATLTLPTMSFTSRLPYM